ncbi:MAG: glycosyltransferase family 87 protein [Desulfobaccales bacterium]
MDWLNRERLTVYPRIFITLYIFVALALVLSAVKSPTGLTDFLDRPLGADFSQFWVASSLALAGDPGEVYDFPKFLAAQEAFFQVKFPFPWVYPPTGLLLVLPLALLPYLASLGVWLAATITPYLAVLRRLAPHPLVIPLALAYPGTFQNLFHGQNGFLTTALIGWGLFLVDHSPLAGGLLLGLASFKPHLMILIPLALIAGRRWQALGALLASVLVFGGISFLVLGGNVWLAFWQNALLPMQLVEQGQMPVHKMITPLAAVLMAGGRLPLALAVQACVMAGVAWGVVWIWRRNTPLALRGSLLVTGILLFTPHAFPYDLALLALPLAWLGWQGQRQGFLPGEQGLLLLIWILPFLVLAAAAVGVQIAPLILLTLFILLLKKGRMASRTA